MAAMAVHRRGDRGAPVRDIQHRLDALGFACADDQPGDFGAATERAVRDFQQERRLSVDGEVGPETWRTMVDAGFVLGDRQLYYRMPMLHGDDVAELQRSLNAIGFDAGTVDGIFGPDTLRALLDFQHNRRLAEDGIAGQNVLDELRLMSRETSKMGRHEVREKVWLASLPDSLLGLRVMIDPFCRDEEESGKTWEVAVDASRALRVLGAHPLASRSADTRPTERLRAVAANERGADLILSFALARSDDEAVYYFASTMSHSAAGSELAHAVARAFGVPALGRVRPILVETRPPTIVVMLRDLRPEIGAETVTAIDRWLRQSLQDSGA